MLAVKISLPECSSRFSRRSQSQSFKPWSLFRPNHGNSKAVTYTPGTLDKAGSSLPSSAHPQGLDKMARTPKKNSNRPQSSQAESPSSFSTAGPNCELLPIHVTAVALHAFYASIV